MKRFKRKCLLAICVLAASVATKAKDRGYVMQVALANGTTECYLVADHPVVKFDQQYVTITCKGLVANYMTREVEGYTFTHSQMGDANVDGFINVKDIAETIKAYITGNHSQISTTLVDFDADGKLTTADITALIDFCVSKDGKQGGK